MKICTVIGARPQFIKASVVSRLIDASDGAREVIIHTGQHYDRNMSDIFFDELGIREPDYNLGIGGGTHGQNTGRMVEAIESILLDEKPDCLLVYGDTDSTLAGALSAVKIHIPVAHVEAGLRSFNRRMPEEINRLLTDHISDLLFPPTQAAVHNLLSEGVGEHKIKIVGDVMMDAAIFYGKIAEERSNVLSTLSLQGKDYALATLHRAENTDCKQRMSGILEGFGRYSGRIILPLHPRTRKKMSEMGLSFPENISLIDPVGYLDMICLEKNARVLATDSGGVQKEAYFHGVPCVTLRDETEWVELVDAGVNTLVGADADRIEMAMHKTAFWIEGAQACLYGSGDAGEKIIVSLLERYQG